MRYIDSNNMNLDLTAFKVVSLLMSPGKLEEKVAYLFDIAMGQNGKQSFKNKLSNGMTELDAMNSLEIDWKNFRLQDAIRKMIYYSVIFPKKYGDLFLMLGSTPQNNYKDSIDI